MKNFTQKFIGLFALVFAMGFTANAQSPCQSTADAYLVIINQLEATSNEYWQDLQICQSASYANEIYLNNCNSDKADLQNELNAANQQIISLQSQLNNSFTQADIDAAVNAAVNAAVDSLSSERDAIISEVNTSSTDDYIILSSGWSMFGYSCVDSIDAVEGFASIADKIEIVKDEWGLSYLPSWGFNAMGSLHYSEGYQIKMTEDVDDFQFCKKTAPIEIGCSDPNAFNYSPNASIILNSVCVDKVFGCIDENAFNYDESANTDDGSCIDVVNGCIDENAFNYNAAANTDDGSCNYLGCMDENAFNYNAVATTDDGSCIHYGCMDENASNFNPNANIDAVVVSNTYFNETIFAEDSNGDITYFTDSFNDDELTAVVNSGGYVLWGSFEIQQNSSVTIALNEGEPFNIESFGSTQIENNNYDSYSYYDCMMLGVEQYNQYYGEYEGVISSCEDLYVFTPMAKVSGSNGFSINISNENYNDFGFGGNWEFWENLSENLSGSDSITIETEENVKFKLTNVSLQTVDDSSSSCTY